MPTFKNVMSNNVYNLNQANLEKLYDYVNSEYCSLESLKVKSKNKFSLLHVNIRSLTKIWKNWRNFLRALERCLT